MTSDSRGNRTVRGARGFSHVEVLVAMLIIGLATPMLMGGIMSSLTRTRQSYDQGAATAWVQGEIDFLRRQCYDGLRPGSRRVAGSGLAPGEPLLPDGFAAGHVLIEQAGPRHLRVTVGLYRDDWSGPSPSGLPTLATTTVIGDLKVAGMCP